MFPEKESSSASTTTRKRKEPSRSTDLDKRPPTYAELPEVFSQLGHRIVSLTFSEETAAEPTEFDAWQLQQYTRLRVWLGGMPKDDVFEREYRKFWPDQDEAVSTASVRELIRGISSEIKKQMPGKDWKPYREALKNVLARELVYVSGARMATRYVGRATKNASDLMQHPTRSEGGIFAAMETPSHNTLDRQRAEYVAGATRAAVDAAGTIEAVFSTMIRAAGEFTLNVMAAPATSRDVSPFARSTDAAEQQEQTRAREEFKDYIRQFGPHTATVSQSEKASWRPGVRSGLSPKRERPPESSSILSEPAPSLPPVPAFEPPSVSLSSSSSSDLLRKPPSPVSELAE